MTEEPLFLLKKQGDRYVFDRPQTDFGWGGIGSMGRNGLFDPSTLGSTHSPYLGGASFAGNGLGRSPLVGPLPYTLPAPPLAVPAPVAANLLLQGSSTPRSLLSPSSNAGNQVAASAEQWQPENRIQAKICHLTSHLDGFHDSVEEDAMLRKEMQEQRNQETLIAIAKLEKALNVEIRRRTESVAESQQNIDRTLAAMMGRFQSRIMERFEQLAQSVGSLGERCSTLERGIQQFKGELPSKLQVETSNLQRAIKGLMADFEGDRRLRSEKDAQWSQRVQEAEYGVDIKMQQELSRFERCSETLQELIDEFASADASAEYTRQRAVVLEYAGELRSMLAEEVKVREHTDDKVVEAINEYTSALHRNLQEAHMT